MYARIQSEVLGEVASSEKGGNSMDEKLFKTMGRIGGANIAMGVICIVIGLVVGVLSIVCGGKLLKDKNNLLF